MYSLVYIIETEICPFYNRVHPFVHKMDYLRSFHTKETIDLKFNSSSTETNVLDSKTLQEYTKMLSSQNVTLHRICFSKSISS